MGMLVDPILVSAPAKVNLFLAVTGLRGDGFHSLASWVVPLAFGDEISVTLSQSKSDSLHFEGVEVACKLEDNLICRALQAYRSRVPDLPPVAIRVMKRIPVQAGLGGGSSDAVATLIALNALAGEPLRSAELCELALPLGSDCPLFFHSSGVVVKGRGEVVEPLAARGGTRKRVMLFKPFLGVDTAWAYGQLMRQAKYVDSGDADRMLYACIDSFYQSSYSFYNSFEAVVFNQMLGLRVLVEAIRAEGVPCGMSGSGSACFAVLESDDAASWVRSKVRSCWGQDAFMVETHLLS